MREEGVRFTCNRCGKEEFKTWGPLQNKYPDQEGAEWFTIDKEVHFCPKCAAKFRDLMFQFIRKKDTIIF